MYRLLKFKTPKSNSLSRLSLNNELNVVPEKSCLFCRILQNYNKVSVSSQSTFVKPNPIKTHKVRKRRSKRFNTTELLEVSSGSTLQRTTKIQTANAKDLKKLLQPTTELEEAYKVKSPTKSLSYLGEHTYNNLTVINQSNTPVGFLSENDQRIISMLGISSFTHYQSEPTVTTSLSNDELIKDEEDIEESLRILAVPEEVKLDSSSDILDTIPILKCNFLPENLEESLESNEEEKEIPELTTVSDKAKKPKHVDLRAKKEVIHKTLAAYAEVASVQKLNYRGLNAVLFFISKSHHKNGISIDDINVYNALLKGYAWKGNTKKILETLEMMKKYDVKSNIQTYVIILNCLGRNPPKHPQYIEKINSFFQDGFSKDITFDRILNEGSFLNFEREYVMEAIKRFKPSYEPKYNQPVVQYKNELVDNLNHGDQLKSIRLQDVANENPGMFTSQQLKEKLMEQIEFEKKISVTVVNVEARDEVSEEVLKYRESLEQLYQHWSDCATKAFNRDLFSLSARRGSTNPDIYLRCIPVADFVTIIIEEAKKIAQGSETYSPTVNMLYKDLGTKVYDRYKVLRKIDTGILDKITNIHTEYIAHYAASHKKLEVQVTTDDNLNTRQKWQWIEHNLKATGASLDMDHREWVPTILTEIGKFLYHIVMHDLTVDVHCMNTTVKTKNYLPAFYKIFRNQGRITKEEVKPHPILPKLYRASVPETLGFPVNEVPMICPPVPWTSVNNGGYLITPTPLLRVPNNACHQMKKIEATDVQNLYPSLDSLNQLAAVPWKVNTQILDVILEVFNSGGSDKLDVPKPPSSLLPPEPPVSIQEMDKLQKYHFFRQKLQYRRKKAEMHSLRCDCLYRLSLANHFRDQVFWLPHNMDFRGRVYPVPPHLNHLGSDLARSMLVFAEPRPLGPDGLDWLKIHLINLTGLKKKDKVADRLQYANESMDLIFDSADRPLDGKRWWAESDEPWQTLASCMEIAAAVRSGDPENFESHFPVHQDGSCNGLQHYAALGRDKAGGYSVNLCSADVPQDVYSAVVTLVEERRKKDAKNDVEVAKHLEGFVKRKVIKQTIMTTVYGVTRFGARLQIAKQLKDIESFPKDQVFPASQYLTTKAFESLRTMFTSTKEIQDWFTECARLISSVAGQHVEWVTPLGLPIVQPYFKVLKKLQANSVYEPYHIDQYEKPNVMKHKNAFPPNFIHSLDSNHMMLTSLNCERAGLTFVSVHDCFWTHASTVPIMNKICREQFVALHSQPILEDLSLFLIENFSFSDIDLYNDGSVVDLSRKKLNKVLTQLPRTGDFDINEVLNSVYFFS